MEPVSLLLIIAICGSLLSLFIQGAAIAGERKPDVNATFPIPFLSCITPAKATFTASPEPTHDRKAEQWNAPTNLIFPHLPKTGNQPVQLAHGKRHYFDGPNGAPVSGLRTNLVLLFTK